LHQLISQTAQYLDSWLSDLLQSELKMKLLEVVGEQVPQCPIAGDATDLHPCTPMAQTLATQLTWHHHQYGRSTFVRRVCAVNGKDTRWCFI